MFGFRKRIPNLLLIDDDRFSRMVIAEYLPKEEFNSISAENGQSGFEMAQREKPSLILLDVNMPGEDGWETLARLRSNESTSNIPVIICSAENDAGSFSKAFDLGAQGFISKPIGEHELLRKIRKILKLSPPSSGKAPGLSSAEFDRENFFDAAIEQGALRLDEMDRWIKEFPGTAREEEALASVQRAAQSLKQIYIAMQCEPIVRVSTSVEDLLTSHRKSGRQASAELAYCCMAAAEILRAIMECLRRRTDWKGSVDPLLKRIERCRSAYN